MSPFGIRIVYGAVVLGIAYFVARDSVVLWVVWMAALFVFWYVGELIRSRQRQKDHDEFLQRWNDRQPKPNTAEAVETGDIISYRFADGLYPIRKITILDQSQSSWGHFLIGYRRGDRVPVPFDNEGYKEVIIDQIEKGRSVRQKQG
ncbi:MAG: hypothetical protein MRJ68_08345 [Nitrospira sp.]|nr:hypothetical protein [Nitrospira sp.]